MYEQICPICKKLFQSRQARAITCSTSCRVTKFRRAQAAEVKALRAQVAAQSGA